MKGESFPVTKDQTFFKRYIDDIINRRKKNANRSFVQ